MSAPATRDHLVCTACGAIAAIEEVPATCRVCDGILDLVIRDRGEAREPPGPEHQGLWRWARFLPHVAPANRVILGEGCSPLLRVDRLAAAEGLETLWVKNDSLQPSGSFKDRALALTASLALQYGRPGLILSSSGNAGASAAAYAARAGLPAIVLVPKTAPRTKLAQILVAGARLVTVDGTTADCCRLAKSAAKRLGYVNATTTYYDPYGVDAYATLSFEIAACRPDVLLLPISCGVLLAGMMKGFVRLREMGMVDRLPRPIAVQPAACAPIEKAYLAGTAVEPWAHQPTIASALNDTLAGYERDGDYTLSWIRRYDGAAVSVTDEELVSAVGRRASVEGILVEPSAAAPVAAIGKLIRSGMISAADRVVAVTTGHGLKDIPEAALPPMPAPIAPTLAELTARLAA